MRGWVIALAGGVVVVAGGMGAFWLGWVQPAKTGDDTLDALLPRTALELAKVGLFGPRYLRAMAAIFHNEHSNGTPTGQVHDILEVGDETLHGGPSGGPGQAYRSTAIDLGLWPSQGDKDAQLDDDDDRAAYVAFVQDPANLGELIRWAVVIFKSKLKIAGGDVAQAVQLYNGSGPAAQQYAQNAQDFSQLVYGEALA